MLSSLFRSGASLAGSAGGTALRSGSSSMFDTANAMNSSSSDFNTSVASSTQDARNKSSAMQNANSIASNNVFNAELDTTVNVSKQYLAARTGMNSATTKLFEQLARA